MRFYDEKICVNFMYFLGDKMSRKPPFKVYSSSNIHRGHPIMTQEDLKGDRSNIFVLFGSKGG